MFHVEHRVVEAWSREYANSESTNHESVKVDPQLYEQMYWDSYPHCPQIL